jgi:hypothetical protein
LQIKDANQFAVRVDGRVSNTDCLVQHIAHVPLLRHGVCQQMLASLQEQDRSAKAVSALQEILPVSQVCRNVGLHAKQYAGFIGRQDGLLLKCSQYCEIPP